MLLMIRNPHVIDYRQLMEVYEQSNVENGALNYPNLCAAEQLLQAEQVLYEYLCEVISNGQAVCAVWAPEGRYKATLRLEPYLDGMLITALETAPAERRNGYATCLLKAVLDASDYTFVYSHIDKQNTASILVHEKCGFRCLKDHAVYLDGSVSFRAYTYIYKK